MTTQPPSRASGVELTEADMARGSARIQRTVSRRLHMAARINGAAVRWKDRTLQIFLGNKPVAAVDFSPAELSHAAHSPYKASVARKISELTGRVLDVTP